jgi:hypothetical protein
MRLLSTPLHFSILALAVKAVLVKASSAPWNDMSSTVQDSSLYIDKPPTNFAPNGRLYSVEAAVRACEDDLDTSSNTVIAIQCHEGVVVVTTMNRSPYVFDPLKLDTESSVEQDDKGDRSSKSLLLLEDEESEADLNMRTRIVTVAPY